MAARYVSSKIIDILKNSSGKEILVEYVERTTAWVRPTGFPAPFVRTEFVQVVADNMNSLQPATKIVAMKESEHQSDMDKRKHYTAFELDEHRNVIRTTHLVKVM